MGRVLIIKNGNSDARINDFARQSFEQSKELDEKLILRYLDIRKNTLTDTRCEKDIVIFEKRRILIRAITDYIAGMTDGYALEEYEKLK